MSLSAHALLGFLAILLARGALNAPAQNRVASDDPAAIVWIPVRGPGGGGGGGGDRTAGPSRRAQKSGADRMTVAVAPAPSLSLAANTPAVPQQQLLIDAKALASGTSSMAGAIEGAPDAVPRGPGDGPGARGGKGDGDGPGNGPGVGGGDDGGCCEEAYHPGNGVEGARVIRQVRPNYTPEALQARIQGVVWLEFIVLPDGTVGAVRVIRSLDSRLGLDQEAIKAIRQWRFVPGTHDGKPVSVVASIELTFRIH